MSDASSGTGRLRFSVVVCTYERADHLARLLASLESQSLRDFETLVVDGSREGEGVRAAVMDARARWESSPRAAPELRLVRSAAGLTRQRNIGLRSVRGEVVCFLDDDVSLPPTFLADAWHQLSRPDMADVGGLAGYDVLNYPKPVTLRWKLRRWLGAVPSLRPGDADHLGRAVPLSIAPPDCGSITVGWLSGYCMIYRRGALAGLSFDEGLPTYGGEDRDFSMLVGARSRLVLCADLKLSHHYAPASRTVGAARVRETVFGMGRSFAKRARGPVDYLTLARWLAAETVIAVLAWLRHPSRDRAQALAALPTGLVAGLRSVSMAPAPARTVRAAE
jgi:GT2 family glycosyltransferase